MPNFKCLSIIVFVEKVTIFRNFFIFTILALRKKFVSFVAVENIVEEISRNCLENQQILNTGASDCKCLYNT